jgi:CheY-like chemotaxis protein
LLLVEDNTHNREMISVWLRRAGAVVEQAENGKVGVELALAGTFDAILMDMQMPVMDGYTATRTLRDHGCTSPIVALTAHAMDEERDKCFAAGCNELLNKPIDFERLQAWLSRLIQLGEKRSPKQHAVAGETTDEEYELQAVLRDYIASLADTLVEIQQAAAISDWRRIGDIAHSLKGSGGTLGFPAVTEVGMELEAAARQSAADEVAISISRFEELVRRQTVGQAFEPAEQLVR